jgi:hypothetical protein
MGEIRKNNKEDVKKLDDDWIKKFEEEDKKYEDFYKENNYYINVHFIYIDDESNIEKIKQEKFFMSIPNYITREEIIYLLKKNTNVNGIKYSIFSLLKYNITLEPEEILNFSNSQEGYFFLTPIKNIDAIFFEKTISTFQDLNDLFFILTESSRKSHNHHSNKKIMQNTNTKKVHIHQIKSNSKRGTRKS